MFKPAVRERKPRIRSNPKVGLQTRRASSSKSSDSEPSGSRKYLRSPQISRDSIETLGQEPSAPSFQYRNCSPSDNGYDAGADTDDACDDGLNESALMYLKAQRRSPQTLNSFVLPKPIPSHRFGGFLRLLARSLHQCSMGIAAGFGLSRQQAAWYKNCWQSPGSQPKSIHLMGQFSEPSAISKTPTKPRSIDSSTTL
ncbi:uncharacterized protein LOC119558240 [Drosophila subpulchrella]|uniref:uncharacterized protein LOC119558240 n=1 Tax=Drosophila subpulchrella TaxID=1486046 RepID=UPI0018A1B039|nr:uncharacterized protein LOC119558240 [Drosophila subpulchrella]